MLSKTIAYVQNSDWNTPFTSDDSNEFTSCRDTFFEGSILFENQASIYQTTKMVLSANDVFFQRLFLIFDSHCSDTWRHYTRPLTHLIPMIFFPIFITDHITQRVLYNKQYHHSELTRYDTLASIRQSTLWGTLWSNTLWVSMISAVIYLTSPNQSNDHFTFTISMLSMSTFATCFLTACGSYKRFNPIIFEHQLNFSSIVPENAP